MVSVVITAYNYDRYIERAIRSVLDQSLNKGLYEIIVVNDCSTDSTAQILENYQEDVRIFNLEQNVGLAAARNIGIKKARGQYIVFLDADDYIQKDLLFVQNTFLNENNALDAVSVDYYLVNERGVHLKHVDASEQPIACGIMFRKDFLYEIGLYDESFRAREEEDLRLRFLKKYNIYNICLPLYRYRFHGNNLTTNHSLMQDAQLKLDEKHR